MEKIKDSEKQQLDHSAIMEMELEDPYFRAKNKESRREPLSTVDRRPLTDSMDYGLSTVN